MTTRDEYIANIDEAIRRAAEVMELEDIEGNDDETYDTIYEERHHCSVCEVRTVMETVWPSLKAYINWLESGLGLELIGGPSEEPDHHA